MQGPGGMGAFGARARLLSPVTPSAEFASPEGDFGRRGESALLLRCFFLSRFAAASSCFAFSLAARAAAAPSSRWASSSVSGSSCSVLAAAASASVVEWRLRERGFERARLMRLGPEAQGGAGWKPQLHAQEEGAVVGEAAVGGAAEFGGRGRVASVDDELAPAWQRRRDATR